MSLSESNIGYVTILNTIISYLQANKTTLNTNLSTNKTFTSNSQFILGDPITTPIMRGRYPFIWVGLSSKDEEYAGVGERKDVIMSALIYPAVTIRKNKADTLTELYYLTDNIEGLMRDNTDLNDAVLWTNTTTTDFFIEDKERTFVAYASIGVDLHIRLD
jgi:hypothetical protein